MNEYRVHSAHWHCECRFKEELLVKVKTWKTEMEKKGLRVNMGKTKIMESGINLDVLKKSGKYPCGVCLTGVGSTNAIQCDGCERWGV